MTPPAGAARRRDPALLALLLLGAALRLARWLDGRSLHSDEAALALNVMSRGFRGLARGLDREQLAPLGFLWLEKAVCLGLGETALALRSPALLAGIGALALFAGLARGLLKPWPARLAVLLFALSEPLVFYSAEVKPYAFDALLAVAIASLALAGGRLASLALLVVGAVGAWVSFASAFCCAAAGAVLLQDARAGRRSRWETAATLGAWLLSFALHARIAMAGAPRALLASFWDFGFPARPWWSDPGWPARTLFGAFRDPAGLEFAGLAAALAAAGAAAMLAAQRRAALLLGLPPLFAFLAAALRLYPFPTSLPGSYPFHGRLVLFVAPALLLFVAKGAGFFADSLVPGRRSLAVLLVAVLSWPPLATAVVALRHPPRFQDVLPLVELLGRRAKPGDFVFVSDWAAYGFEFHRRGKSRDAPVLDALRVRALKVHGTRADYERELGVLGPGQRAWTVFTHHRDWSSERDEALAEELLSARGERMLRRLAPGASAQLYRIAGEGEP
jgi:hypothetical protein